MPTKFGFYSYYDTPEGQDSVWKTLYTTRKAAELGAIGSVYYMIAITKPVTAVEVASTFLRIVPAAAGIGFAYGSVACMSHNLRGKESALDHLYAGIAAGSVLGARIGTVKAGVLASIAFGLTGAIIKQLKIEGVTFFPEVLNHDRGTLFQYKNQYDPWFRKDV